MLYVIIDEAAMLKAHRRPTLSLDTIFSATGLYVLGLYATYKYNVEGLNMVCFLLWLFFNMMCIERLHTRYRVTSTSSENAEECDIWIYSISSSTGLQ